MLKHSSACLHTTHADCVWQICGVKISTFAKCQENSRCEEGFLLTDEPGPSVWKWDFVKFTQRDILRLDKSQDKNYIAYQKFTKRFCSVPRSKMKHNLKCKKRKKVIIEVGPHFLQNSTKLVSSICVLFFALRMASYISAVSSFVTDLRVGARNGKVGNADGVGLLVVLTGPLSFPT